MKLSLEEINTKNGNRTIVKLMRSAWHDHDGAYQRLSLKLLKRLSGANGDYFLEDCANVGAMDFFKMIINFNECPDGYYELATCNEHRDWESGYIDDYDYKLIPYDMRGKE